MIDQTFNQEQSRLLGRAEGALHWLAQWAEMAAGEPDLLRVVNDKIAELQKKISYLRLEACPDCGQKSYLKDTECPFCGHPSLNHGDRSISHNYSSFTQ